MKLTKSQAEEIRYRLDILASEPDLCADYGLTEAQAEALVASVPAKGGWDIPSWGLEAVLGEVEHAAWHLVLIADDIKADAPTEARRIRREARDLEKILPE